MEQVVQTEEVVIVFDYPCHYLLSTFGISYLLVHVWDIVLIGVTSRFISNIICVGLGNLSKIEEKCLLHNFMTIQVSKLSQKPFVVFVYRGTQIILRICRSFSLLPRI